MKAKTKNPVPTNKIRNEEHSRLKGVITNLRRKRKGLKDRIRNQTVALDLKSGQLKDRIKRQLRSDEQVLILTKAIESATDGIFIVIAHKPDYPFIYVNKSFQRMTGYAKREILGKNYFLFYGINLDSRAVNLIKQALQKGRTFHGDLLNIRKDGKKCWNSLRISPVRDTSGFVTHYVGVKTDITLTRERELKINEQREELLHVTRVGKLAEFVSSLAHEISQPLAAILSYSQAAKRMLTDNNSELQKVLTYIIDDDQRAAKVIQRLRLLLKKGKADIKLLDINILINETVTLITTDAIVRNVDLRMELDNGLPLIRGDQIQLQQVLLNLISNSFDALESSQGNREILIRTKRLDADTIIVDVEDSGCGIPAQNIPKLFSHFYTSKLDGLGMGLSISRSIVEAHGGRLSVSNNSDRGATFYFTIPVNVKDA